MTPRDRIPSRARQQHVFFMRLFFDTEIAGINRIEDQRVEWTWIPLRCVLVLAIFPCAAQANTNLDPGGAIGLVVWLLIIGLAWGFLKSLFQKGKAQATSKSYQGASRPVEPPTSPTESIQTHYDNLQVARTASDTVIRSAYKGLAQKYHPDRFDGDPAHAERIMKFLNEAYAVLSDPVRRKEHDKWIDEQQGTVARLSPSEVDVPPDPEWTRRAKWLKKYGVMMLLATTPGLLWAFVILPLGGTPPPAQGSLAYSFAAISVLGWVISVIMMIVGSIVLPVVEGFIHGLRDDGS